MEWQLAVLVAASVSSVAVGILTIFVLVPRYRRSAYRYKLWRLRDRLWDAIDQRKVRDRELAEDVLDEIEASIRHAGDLTVMNGVVAWLVLYGWSMPTRQLLQEGRHERTDARVARSKDPVLKSIYAAYESTSIRYLVTGSVLGWLMAVTVLLIVVMRQVRHGRRASQPNATTTVQAKRRFHTALVMTSAGSRRRAFATGSALSECVS